MTKDKSDYTGQINAKKLGGTGITESIIGKHHHDEGGSLVIVAAISVSDVKKKVKDGTGTVNYVIDDLEVAPTTAGAADYVRELIKAFHYERMLEQNGPTLLTDGDSPEPKVSDVLEQGARFAPHPFLPDDAAKDAPICDVCGALEDAPIHADRTALDDPFTAGDPAA